MMTLRMNIYVPLLRLSQNALRFHDLILWEKTVGAATPLIRKQIVHALLYSWRDASVFIFG